MIDPERRTDRLVAECHRKLVANIERGDRFPLFWTLYETFKKAFWLGGVLRLTADVLLIATPFTLRYLIQFTMDAYQAGLKGEAGPSISHGVGYLIGISGMLTIQSLCHNHYMYTLGLIGGQCRAILSSAIFDKSLRIMGRATGPASKCSQEQAPHERSSHQHPQRHTLGHATHLLSVDVARVDKVTSAIHLLWTSPVALLLAVALCMMRNMHSMSRRELIGISDCQPACKRSCRTCSHDRRFRRADYRRRHSLSPEESYRWTHASTALHDSRGAERNITNQMFWLGGKNCQIDL